MIQMDDWSVQTQKNFKQPLQNTIDLWIEKIKNKKKKKIIYILSLGSVLKFSSL
jgi:hypothetical protein